MKAKINCLGDIRFKIDNQKYEILTTPDEICMSLYGRKTLNGQERVHLKLAMNILIIRMRVCNNNWRKMHGLVKRKRTK